MLIFLDLKTSKSVYIYCTVIYSFCLNKMSVKAHEMHEISQTKTKSRHAEHSLNYVNFAQNILKIA